MIDFYPAIDIKNGIFIRLKKGDLKHMITYGNDPVNQAKKFCLSGAKWIHVVDIDGAFDGESKNMNTTLKKREQFQKELNPSKTNSQLLFVNFSIMSSRVALSAVAVKADMFALGKISFSLDSAS